MNVQLRPYQLQGIRDIFNAWAKKPEGLDLMNVLYQMPTGTGKTTLFSEIVRKAENKNKKVLLVVHRLELVEQICERLTHFDIIAGVIIAGVKPDLERSVQVASIQTLNRRDYPPADLIIIDECHHSKAKSYKKLWEIYPDARFLGVTATPIRLNGEGFDDQYDILITSGQIADFIKMGYLVKAKHMVCSNPDVSKVKKRQGDYDSAMLKGVMLDNSLMANLVESYKVIAPGKKMIVFAVDIEHSKNIVARYNEAGLQAIHIDAETPKIQRAEIMEKFRTGEIKILSNIDIVSEGFDVPNCDAVQLARPTKSLGLYLQQIGRCLRPSPNKDYGLILDNAGLWLEHGLSVIEREWTLFGTKKEFYKKGHKKKMVGFDQDGIIREIFGPKETEGLELKEMTMEMERLLKFESCLINAKTRGHKIISAFFRYDDYLKELDIKMTTAEIEYCQRRIGDAVKPGFWYHRLMEIKENEVSLH